MYIKKISLILQESFLQINFGKSSQKSQIRVWASDGASGYVNQRCQSSFFLFFFFSNPVSICLVNDKLFPPLNVWQADNYSTLQTDNVGTLEKGN